jgi:hypothetical protein
MRRSRFALVLTVLSLFAMPILAFARLAGGFMRDAFALFTPEPMRLAADGFDTPLAIDGTALARDVQQGLRHEAGVPRYSSARNT